MTQEPLVAEGPIVPGVRDSSAGFWRKIESFLKDGTLIPVLGPGVITFGEDDRPLYPWIVAQLAAKYGLDPVPSNINGVVCANLRKNGNLEDMYLDIDELLDSAEITPGPLLKSLASLSQCRLFFTVGFDPLMERALDILRGFGSPITTSWSFSLKSKATDLPNMAGVGAFLGYLFGKVSPNSGYLLWDADAIEFVLALERQLPNLPSLFTTLTQNNLLVMGANFPDWLSRFLVRAIRQCEFTDSADKQFLVADSEPPSLADAALFYGSLKGTIKGGIQLLPGDPVAFGHEFCRRAHAQVPPLTAGVVPGTKISVPYMTQVMEKGSIFISYSHVPDDAVATFRIVELLRAVGCLVWIDEKRLICGDNFENKLQDAVRRCSFFLSVISNTTETVGESYYHKERKWAAERFESISDAVHFYFPVIVDATPVPPRYEPAKFKDITAWNAPKGELSPFFVAHLAELQRLARNVETTPDSLPR